ncbi:MAG: hypothetical protein ABJP34_13240 [Erythrobacter sp.]
MTKKTRKFGLLFLAHTMVLGGCAASSDKYPSLAIRDFERSPQTAENVAPAATPSQTFTISNSTLASLNQARGRAQSQHSAFLAALPATRRKVSAARGAGPTSDSWAEAQIALADLISKRSQTAIVLGDVDLLIVETAIAAKGADYPRAIQNEVSAMLASQDRSIAQLKAGL